MIIKMTEEEYDKLDPLAKIIKDCPCSICGRKSTARMREPHDDEIYVFAVCDDHMEHLVKRCFK